MTHLVELQQALQEARNLVATLEQAQRLATIDLARTRQQDISLMLATALTGNTK